MTIMPVFLDYINLAILYTVIIFPVLSENKWKIYFFLKSGILLTPSAIGNLPLQAASFM